MDRVAYVQHASTYRHFKHHIMYRHRPIDLPMHICFMPAQLIHFNAWKVCTTESPLLLYTHMAGGGWDGD